MVAAFLHRHGPTHFRQHLTQDAIGDRLTVDQDAITIEQDSFKSGHAKLNCEIFDMTDEYIICLVCYIFNSKLGN
jgi:hypothetical protein